MGLEKIDTNFNLSSNVGDSESEVCSVCGCSKVVTMPDGTKFKCLCQCEKTRMQNEERELNLKQLKVQIEHKKAQSLLGKRYKDATFETAVIDENNEKAIEVIKSYAIKCDEMLDKGYGMYIYGKNGCGKTYLTACLCNYLTERNKKCIFTNFSSIFNEMKTTYSRQVDDTQESVIDKYSKVPFLIIDDFGKEMRKREGESLGWADEQMFIILNNRYNNMLPTIFTSNYSLDDATNDFNLEPSTLDRISSLSTKKVYVGGGSRR